MNHQMAQHVQSQGRGEDTMLVHMTPNEVNSLQGLAMAHGGSLTINPHTGLPEAGWLGKLLPTILGIGLNFIPGVGPLLSAGLVAAGSTAATGSLKKGLLAGLQAYGGASLAGAAFPTATGTIAKTAGTIASNAGGSAVGQIGTVGGITPQLAVPSAITNAASGVATPALGGLAASAPSVASGAASGFVPSIALESGAAAAKGGIGGLMQNFGKAATQGLPAGTPSIVRKVAPMLAAQGVLSGVSGAMAPRTGGTTTSGGQVDNSYTGPYYAEPRKVIASPTTEELKTKSGERNWFDVSQPAIFNTMGQMVQPGSNTAQGTMIMRPILNPNAKKGEPMYTYTQVPYMGGVPQQPNYMDGFPQQGEADQQTGYATGGELHMDEGGFVIPARAVAEAGSGYTDAGFEHFAKMGGIPLRGKGNGVSDDIPARIGNQKARVAAGEVYMPPAAVRRAGGAKKLYALVDKAHRAHKRGADSSIAKGLRGL